MSEAVKEIMDVLNREDLREYPRESIDLALQNEKDLAGVYWFGNILHRLIRRPQGFSGKDERRCEVRDWG